MPAAATTLHEVPTPRSAATRAKLMAVAERLFAERSIAGVSLNEISKAAGQRNSNVCQYHFGDKQGLVQAILDKHVPGIASRREALLDSIERRDRTDRIDRNGHGRLRSLVEAFVRPVAEKLHDADGGRDFIRINAQLIALHTLSVQGLPASPLRLARADRFSRELRAALGSRLPDAIAQQRLMLAAVLLFHGLDDFSRLLDASGRRGATTNAELFGASLEDAIVALLSAPVGAQSRARETS
jgi:AcrR family transcriptional regulator